ncbi:MAG: glycosyltransferase family 4 protein [Candidatus Zixiibacteriota bacterium]|nr:MAG: glycosyltransferase family 4 protein [candidate division Zixibacteria bacterium]
MRILLVTQHFPPEKGAVRRLFEFARYFRNCGHHVTVLTAMPNYPDGIIPKEYRGKLFCKEFINGIDIYRSYVLPASNAQPKKRMLGFLTFMISSLINSLRLKGKFDVVLASSPPVTSAALGYIFCKIRRAKLILEIRDLQPEMGEQYGSLHKSLFTEAIRGMMKFIYKRAWKIVCVTEGLTSWMRTRGIPENRISTIKSGVGEDFINSHSNGIRKKYGWEEKYLILFCGTMGTVRTLEPVIESARILADEKQYHFVFVGDGQKKETYRQLAKQYNLTNISFIGLQPLEQIPYFLHAGDVLVDCLKDVPFAQSVLPVKMFEYMAAGKPIIFGSTAEEATRFLDQAGGALTFSDKRPEELVHLIRDLYRNRIDGSNLGRRYHEYVRSHHSTEKWARRYLKIIEGVTDS